MAETVSTKCAPRVVAVLALAVATTLMACGGDGTKRSPLSAGQNVPKDRVGRFAIDQDDLPTGYERVGSQSGRVECDSGWLANRGDVAETPGEASIKQQLLVLGPQACNLSTYEVTVGGGTTGLQAFAIVFADESAASQSLPLIRKSFVDFADLDTPGQDVASAGVGDESVPGIRWVPPRGIGVPGFRFSEVHIWRVRNVALTLQSGVTTGLSVDDVLDVARKLSSRGLT